jgi:hypothetical protein
MNTLLRLKSIFLLVGLGLIAAPAQAATGVGPYYAMPAWDQTLPAATRFLVLTNMNSEAVLDRETGLVWEQSPDTSTENWGNASYHCLNLAKGGKKGWRLPTVDELTSLVDPTQSNPALPAGHPFSDVQSSDYWSATTNANNATNVWAANFNDGNVDNNDKSNTHYVWCVRGGA